MADIPITTGQGQASVATEVIGTSNYQKIKIVGGETGSTSVMGVNPDRSINVSVIGTISTVGSISGALNISGSVMLGSSNASIITRWADSSVLAIPTGSIVTVIQSSSIIAIATGSVTAIPTGNQSVSGAIGQVGTWNASVEGMQAIGTAVASRPIQVGGKDLDGSVVGARFARDGDFITQLHSSITGLADNITNSLAIPVGTDNGGFTVFPTMQYVFDGTTWDRTRGNSANGMVVQTGNASVITVNQGSSVIAILQSSSIFTAVQGSVATVQIGQIGTQITSISGAVLTSDVKAEDTAHGTGDSGSFNLAVRNDTLASVTGADKDYTQFTVGPSGELINANAPFTKWVQGTADLRVVLGASVTAIAAQGTSVFTYITGVQVANMGSASVLVTLAGGLGSILGYTIAPAGGGSNIVYTNALKTGANSAFTASISGTASVLVSAQGFIANI